MCMLKANLEKIHVLTTYGFLSSSNCVIRDVTQMSLLSDKIAVQHLANDRLDEEIIMSFLFSVPSSILLDVYAENPHHLHHL